MENITNNTNETNINRIGGYFDSLGTQRLAELSSAKTLLQTHANTLAAEQKRLTAKYGADDPRVLSKGLQLNGIQMISVSVDAELARASTKPIVTDPAAAGLLQGIIYQDGKPLPNTSISVVSEQQEVIQTTCSDPQGNFAFSLNGDTIAKLNSIPCFLQASGKNKKVIYQGKDRLSVTIGKITYENISINSAACS